MPARDAIDALLVVPLLGLLDEAPTAADLATAMTGDGLELGSERAERVLARATDLGLARVAGYDSGQARYVVTTLGRRSIAAMVARDPAVAPGLAELERLRTDLLATVGHELRTPLTAIRTSAGLLLDPGLDPTTEQRQQLVGTIARSADRMQRLVTDLLDLARLRAGRAEMTHGSVDARSVASEVVAAVEPMAAARDQSLRLDLPATPVVVHGDRRRLEQALLNLVANAQKFSATGAEIVVRVERDDASARVRWTVIDRGPGISEEERERLFERFFVGTSDRHGAGGGAGIGLPTALAIAQAHGGTIEVESEVGRGSTFHLVVPVDGPAS